MRKTKIICTLGPTADSTEMITALAEAGMNVARFNFSHGSYEEHRKRIDSVEAVREKTGLTIATLLDTKGPEVRVGKFLDDQKIPLVKGSLFTLTTRDILGDQDKVSVSYKGLVGDVKPGSIILIDDGLVELVVEEIKDGTEIVCRVQNPGVVSNNKGVNVPNLRLSLPYMSERDKADIRFGVHNGFDFIAASFVRCAADVLEIKALLAEEGCDWIQIIAKIENREGVENLERILQVADGIMVARGDLGVEVPFEDIPSIQNLLIQKTQHAGKTVIIATQMLDSMMRNPRPTRAEVTDIASAIYEGAGAIMLSGETANGDYPLAALETMVKIAVRTEADMDYERALDRYRFEKSGDRFGDANITNAIAHATCTTARDLLASAILTVTKSGHTARMISKYRPGCRIIGATPDQRVCRQLALVWGVTPLLVSEELNNNHYLTPAENFAKEASLLRDGNLVVVTAGLPLGQTGKTNLLRVHVVGEPE